MKKRNRDQEQSGKPRRLVLSRETIMTLNEPSLLALARGGEAAAPGFTGTGPVATIDSNS